MEKKNINIINNVAFLGNERERKRGEREYERERERAHKIIMLKSLSFNSIECVMHARFFSLSNSCCYCVRINYIVARAPSLSPLHTRK